MFSLRCVEKREKNGFLPTERVPFAKCVPKILNGGRTMFFEDDGGNITTIDGALSRMERNPLLHGGDDFILF